jgi:hypothetical protein
MTNEAMIHQFSFKKGSDQGLLQRSKNRPKGYGSILNEKLMPHNEGSSAVACCVSGNAFWDWDHDEENADKLSA